MVCVECLVGKQNNPTLFKVTEPVTIGFGDFGISISLDVFCRLRSPSNCVSDGRFYCFRSSIVVTLDGTRCVGGASGVCVVIIPIVVGLPGLFAVLPVSVARLLYWRTLYTMFKRLPSSIISLAIHIRTLLMSCWEKESGCWMSIKAAYRHIAVEGIGRVRRNATA